MKLVVQIALGIILATVVIWGSSLIFTAYMAKAVLDESKEIQTKWLQEQQILQERVLKQKEQQAKEENQNLERLKQFREEKIIKDKRIKKAWGKFYEIPYQCKHALTKMELDWCFKYRTVEKKRFNILVREGKIKY